MTALSAFALVSCVTNELVPSQSAPAVAFVTKNAGDAQVEISRRGETKQVSIKATCDWTLTTDSDWVKISPMSGTEATKDITVTVDSENNADDDRTAKVIIFKAADSLPCDTLFVIQKGAAGEFDGRIKSAEAFVSFIAQAGELVESDEVELMADIDLAGAVIAPVEKFSAIFNGNNHKVYNFTIASEKAEAGMFLANYGTIRDLIVGSKDGQSWDGSSKISFADGMTGNSAGIVAVNYGTVENVKNFASVDFNAANASDADSSVGGIVGLVGSVSSVIKNCENYGTITYTGAQNYRSSMGGVLGLSGQSGAVIENCLNAGAIVKATANQKEFAMAGVVGRANDQLIIKNCTNEGPVSYESTEKPGSYIHIAGIIGAAYKNSQISGSRNKGEVTSVINQVNRIGGIAGTMNTGGVIEDCINDGAVSVKQAANANWQAAAGICGFEEKATSTIPFIIRNCTNNAAVSLELENTTTHANKASVGGIIGLACSVVEFTGNTNNGKISAKNTGGTPVYAGGIIGNNSKGTMTLTGNTNTGAVSFEAADGTAGGVIGFAQAAGAVIKENIDRGNVSGSVASAIGAVAGITAASLNSCAVGSDVTVGGQTVTMANLAALIQGSASTGAPVACYVEGAAPVDYLSAAPAELAFVAAGESKTITVSSNCEWTATSSEGWLTLSEAAGNGEATITVTAAENPAKQERTAVITIVAKNDATLSATVNVKQAEKPGALPGNQIKSAADLKTFLTIAAEAEAGETFTIESDIDYTSETLVPADAFAGVLDGKNHKITFATEADAAFIALIKTLTGTVKNITTAGSLKSTYSGTGEHFVTSIAAYVDGGLVENCTNEAAITLASTGTGSYAYLSGVVSHFRLDGATVKNCTNKGKLTLSNACQTILGGVAAYGVTNANAPTLSLIDCVNSGDIEINHEGANWDYIGGVVGKMGASSNPFTMFYIKNCKFSGKMTVTKAPKIRGGGVFGSCGASTDYEVSGCEFSGTIDITDTQAVDRLFGGVGPGFSETAASGTISNCVFNGDIKAVTGGNLYLGGIFGNNGAATVVIDGCKATAKSSIGGYTSAKSIGVIAARPNKAGFTVKNCKVAGKVTSAAGEEITISADNVADWMFKGSATTVAVTLENNGFNAE